MACGVSAASHFDRGSKITMKIWMTGAEGHIAKALRRRFDTERYTLLTTDKDVDITDFQAVLAYAEANRPDVIFNLAAETNHDLCTAMPDWAFRVNAIGARNVAVAANRIGARLLHISSDDLFMGDNDGYPFNEFDTPVPCTAYGRSKLAGEKLVAQVCPQAVILRSSWVYGIGDDFVDAILSAAKDPTCPWLMIPTDYVGCPTSAKELMRVISTLLERPECSGIYHVVCQGYCTRYDYAKEILRCAGLRKQLEIRPTVSNEMRAEYTVLDNMMLRLEGILEPKEWKKALAEYIAEERE